jgi:hypothetical protein
MSILTDLFPFLGAKDEAKFKSIDSGSGPNRLPKAAGEYQDEFVVRKNERVSAKMMLGNLRTSEWYQINGRIMRISADVLLERRFLVVLGVSDCQLQKSLLQCQLLHFSASGMQPR